MPVAGKEMVPHRLVGVGLRAHWPTDRARKCFASGSQMAAAAGNGMQHAMIRETLLPAIFVRA